jgi:hypothetical protein
MELLKEIHSCWIIPGFLQKGEVIDGLFGSKQTIT